MVSSATVVCDVGPAACVSFDVCVADDHSSFGRSPSDLLSEYIVNPFVRLVSFVVHIELYNMLRSRERVVLGMKWPQSRGPG